MEPRAWGTSVVMASIAMWSTLSARMDQPSLQWARTEAKCSLKYCLIWILKEIFIDNIIKIHLWIIDIMQPSGASGFYLTSRGRRRRRFCLPAVWGWPEGMCRSLHRVHIRLGPLKKREHLIEVIMWRMWSRSESLNTSIPWRNEAWTLEPNLDCLTGLCDECDW